MTILNVILYFVNLITATIGHILFPLFPLFKYKITTKLITDNSPGRFIEQADETVINVIFVLCSYFAHHLTHIKIIQHRIPLVPQT